MPKKNIVAFFTEREKGRIYRGFLWDENGRLVFVSYKVLGDDIEDGWFGVWLEFDSNIKKLGVSLDELYFYEIEILEILETVV